MTDSAFSAGQQVKLQAVFKDSTGGEEDPTAGTLLYVNPYGTVTSVALASLTKDTTGTYYYLVTPTSTEAGTWRYGARSTGGIFTADLTGRFYVLESEITT